MIYKIYDWTGADLGHGNFKKFDDAEEFLCEFLNDNYETDRGEYYILPRYKTLGDFSK